MKPLPGQMKRAYVAICFKCQASLISFAADQGRAETAMRDEGWSKKANGWHCDECKKEKD